MEELGKGTGEIPLFGEQKQEKAIIMEAEKQPPGKKEEDQKGGSKDKNPTR